MKLKVAYMRTFNRWIDRAVRVTDSKTPYSYHEDKVRLLDVRKLSTLSRPRFKEIKASPNASIEEIIYRLTGKETITIEIFEDEASEVKKTTTRCLYCLSVSRDKLNPSYTLADYNIQEDDLLLLDEYFKIETNVRARHSFVIYRDVDDFNRIVRTIEDIEKSPGLLFPARPPEKSTKSALVSFAAFGMKVGLRPVECVLLYTDEDVELAKYIRYNFSTLDEMTGDHLNIYTIEQRTHLIDVSTREYWKAALEQTTYSFLHMMGWTRHKPYDKSQAYKVANLLGVYPDALPCVVFFGNLKSDEKIVVEISGEIKTFFRILSSAVLDTMSKMIEEKINLYGNFDEFKKIFIENWNARQDKVGGKKNQTTTFTFNGQTVFINRPSGQVEIKDFQRE